MKSLFLAAAELETFLVKQDPPQEGEFDVWEDEQVWPDS
jgi:hypothetical protein